MALNNKILVLAFLGFTMMLLHPYTGESQPTDLALELSISVDKEVFLVGEPVQITFQLKNLSDQELSNIAELSFISGTLMTFFRQSGNDFEPYFPRSREVSDLMDRAVIPITLKAGEMLGNIEYISFNVVTSDFAFPVAGNFELKATHLISNEDPNMFVESNTLSISVINPVGVDQDALNFIQINGLNRFLTPESELFPHDDSIISKLNELIKTFPESLYLPYAKLGRSSLCQGRFELSDCFLPSFLFEQTLILGEAATIELPEDILSEINEPSIRYVELPNQTREGGVHSDSLEEASLSLDQDTGVITGRPTTSGEFLIWIQVFSEENIPIADIWPILSIEAR